MLTQMMSASFGSVVRTNSGRVRNSSTWGMSVNTRSARPSFGCILLVNGASSVFVEGQMLLD
uniref:Uncharacterized protein n=1 Tax=Arundo donax TaxID=35708 RepID=A0A0A9H4T7_ARUDO